MRIDIEDVIRNHEERAKWNKEDFSTLKFYVNNIPIAIEPEVIEDWKYVGLCNTDFVMHELTNLMEDK